jgi:hypothetical protein
MTGPLDRAVARALARATRRDARQALQLLRPGRHRDTDWLDLFAACLFSRSWWGRWLRYHGGPPAPAVGSAPAPAVPTPTPHRGN